MDNFDLLFNEELETNLIGDIGSESVRIKKDNSRSMISASIVLIPIIFFEILVCIIGSQFYTKIGYSLYSATVLAVTIEVFYMYFSSKKSFTATLLKIVLLSVSITTLSYSAYLKDSNVNENKTRLQKSITEGELRLSSILEDQRALKVKDQNVEKDMEIYRKHSMASKGNLVLGPRRSSINSQRSELKIERSSIIDSLNLGRAELSTQSVIKNIGILTIQTLMTILTFSIIQIAICIALPDLINKLENK